METDVAGTCAASVRAILRELSLGDTALVIAPD